MREACPDFFPEDWVNPKIVRTEYYDVKEYEDGVRAIIEEPAYVDGYAISPPMFETRYPNRALHYEYYYDDNGNRLDIPIYIPDGIPEDAEI